MDAILGTNSYEDIVKCHERRRWAAGIYENFETLEGLPKLTDQAEL